MSADMNPERDRSEYVPATPPPHHRSTIRISKRQEIPQSSKPLVEEFFDRSPTKPERKYSPPRSTRNREEEKVKKFLAETTARKTEVKLREEDDPSTSAKLHQDNAPRLPFPPRRHVHLEARSTPSRNNGPSEVTDLFDRVALDATTKRMSSSPNHYSPSSQRSLQSRPKGYPSNSNIIHNRDGTTVVATPSPSPPPPPRLMLRPESRASSSASTMPTTAASRYSHCFATAISSATTTTDDTHAPHQQPSRAKVCMMVQVAPGVTAPLRGSRETWKAIQEDFYMPGMCCVCDTTLFVIQDAGYVLCPDCRTVSPMEGEFVDRASAGVGLGFKYDDLMRWQSEIVEQRKKDSKV